MACEPTRPLPRQTLSCSQGFYVSMRHCKPFCLGLNCALGATQMRPFLQRLAKVAECFVHVYSNAGLPNAMGGYDDTPADMARDNKLFAEEGLINMLGGCCGSTPAHIKASGEEQHREKRETTRFRSMVFLFKLDVCIEEQGGAKRLTLKEKEDVPEPRAGSLHSSTRHATLPPAPSCTHPSMC